MLCALHIANFRSLGPDVSVDFSDDATHLVLLAGPNGAGKSNVLDAFRFLRDAVTPRGLEEAVRARFGIHALLRQGTKRAHFAVETVFGDEWVVWGLEIGRWGEDDFAVWDEALFVNHLSLRDSIHARARTRVQGDGEGHVPEFARALVEALAAREPDTPHTVLLRVGPDTHESRRRELTLPSLQRTGAASVAGRVCALLDEFAVYAIHFDDLREPQLRSPSPRLSDRADNWINALSHLADDDRTDLIAGLGALVPDLRDLRVVRVGDYLQAFFEHGSNGTAVEIPMNRESDGTLRTAAMLVALLQQPPPSLIAIEEPELAVHVRAMAVLRDYILPRARHTPVLLSTHSSELLDLFPVECVRVVDRTAGGTSVAPLSERQRGLVCDHLFTLGQLLLAQPLEGDRRG